MVGLKETRTCFFPITEEGHLGLLLHNANKNDLDTLGVSYVDTEGTNQNEVMKTTQNTS